jgi:hypothetical protein
MTNVRGQRARVRAGAASEINGQQLFSVCEAGYGVFGQPLAFLGSRAARGSCKNVGGFSEAFANFVLVGRVRSHGYFASSYFRAIKGIVNLVAQASACRGSPLQELKPTG